ncbi:LacI family DNA-binding transcriptional regulator [Pelomonas sp. KK5]|uniref:LacI family DNA-binding transcriptional regulator n=1 Tax=Pelomonas sp. KK5 TaxID=1855730 RepID=UPI00097C76D8|nr:LacI family DNA-binding transcriptional regulator [Pelomonas sp. KK5]
MNEETSISSRRAQLSDVAEAAGVSLATVDRVLNGRAGVRASTVAQVHAAVQKLGYRADPAASRLARGKSRSVAVVLPAGTNSFVAMLVEQVSQLGAWLHELRLTARIDWVDVFSPDVLARHLASLRGQHEAVIVMGLDHPRVRAAIDDLCDAGMTVVTLVSDVPASRRAHYVGIDNVAAGRTAATLLGRFVGRNAAAGRIGVLMGSHGLRDHAERLFGFQQVMAGEHAHLTVLPALQGHDDPVRTEQLIRELLQQEPQLAGIYSIGAGNRGIAAALEASGRAQQIVWICHELTPHARRALLDGVADAVIYQDAGHEMRSAFRLAQARLNRETLLADQERIRIGVYVKENLP